MNIFTSIYTKLLCTHLGAIIVASLLLGAASFHLFSKNLLAVEQNSLQSASRHSASMVAGQLKNTAGTLQLIANGREVKEYLKTFRDDALIEYLSLYQKTFENIAFINQDGTEEVRVIHGIAIDPITDGTRDEYTPELLAHPNEARFFWGRNWRNESSPALQIGLAVFNYFGDTFTAILQAEISYAHLLHHISNLALGESGYLVLVDKKGHMVLYAQQSPTNTEKFSFQKYDIKSSPLPFSLQDEVFLRTDFLGEDSLLSASPVEGFDLIILAVLPYRELNDKFNELFRRSLLIFLVVTLLGALVASLLARKISHPIAHLTRITRDIMKGEKKNVDFSNIQSRDEVGLLVKSFQEMLENLHRTTVSRNFMDSILETAGESVLVLTPKGKIRMANKASHEMLGYETNQLLGCSMADILSSDFNTLNDFLTKMKHGLSRQETTYRHREGKNIPILLSAKLLPGKDDQGGFVCIAADISRLIGIRQALNDNQLYLQSMMAAMPTALIVIDSDYKTIIDANPSACAMFGAPREKIVGKICHQFICPAEEDQCPVIDIGENLNSSERTMLTISGEKKSILKSVKKITLSGSTLLVEAFVDISDRKAAEEALRKSEEALRQISITDELTGLLNRRGFMTLARKQLQIISRTGSKGFLLYADVDNLKGVNDTLGHAVGDMMIYDTADVLKRVCRKSDIIGRLGGDEFAVLLTDSDNESAIINRLNSEIAAANEQQGADYYLSISTGITYCDPQEKMFTIEKFMSLADQKMYITKNKRKESSTVYKHQ